MASPPPPRPHPLAAITAHPWRTLFALLVLASVVLVLLWDWNWFKGPIERQVGARTGRTFAIGGNLDVDLGRDAVIRADALRFGNAAWAQDPTMAAADRLELHIETLPLLFKRELRIPELRLTRPRVLLETGATEGNWVFGEPGSGKMPTIRRLWVDDGRLRFVDARRRTDIDVKIATLQPKREDAAPPISIDGGGRWSGNTFTLAGRAESPFELQNTDQPYRINLRATAGRTRAHARGTLVNPLALESFDLQFTLAGANLNDLYPLIGVALPPTPPYALDGRLGHVGRVWSYRGFTGAVGDSDLRGDASVTLGGARTFLRATLASKRLDFDDLAGFVGAAPQTAGSETSNAELAALAAKQAASTRVLPDTPYALDKLRTMDADVTLKARRINAPSLPIDDMDAHLFLDDGVLRLDPLNFGFAGGDIRSTIRMNAREPTIRTRADITLRGLNLAQLMPGIELAKDAVGRVGGRIKLDTRGNSIAKMLGSADGTIAVGMGRGQVSKLLMKLAGLNLGGALRTKLAGDKSILIRCAYGDFTVKDGVMNARALEFDTTDTVVLGSGDISLRDETLDLTMRPRPKVRSPLSLRAPLYVDGTFKHPNFRPDYTRIGLRGAAAIALGVIAPPAALLATLEFGGGKDSDCAR
ncbi:MAG: AsmA family protein [Luteimonas sp.]